MTTVNAISNAPVDMAALMGSSAPTASADTGQDAQDKFLKLLVTQMRNQDPLNPMDNAEVTSQLAQLSTVSGIKDLNTTLTALSTSIDAKQYLQAANLVGHLVAVDELGVVDPADNAPDHVPLDHYVWNRKQDGVVFHTEWLAVRKIQRWRLANRRCTFCRQQAER